MGTFTDGNGQQWVINVTAATRSQVRRHVGFDLLDLCRPGTAEAAAERLASDPERLVRVLWLLLEPAADARGVEPEAFAAALGPVLGDATEAMLSAVVRFAGKAA